MRTVHKVAFFVLVTLGLAAEAEAQVILFRDQMTNGGAWAQNDGGDGDVSATFAYDYSADGIPEAPNSQGGDASTSGLKMEANNGDDIGAGAWFITYPLEQNFTGAYTLRFDAWMNYDAVGADGTTEFLGGGIGYDNVANDVVSGAQFLATGDGGSSADWRAFKSPGSGNFFYIPEVDMTGGSRDGGEAYYASFLPAVIPPPSQNQEGFMSTEGSPGFQWITWEAAFDGADVTISIEKPSGDKLEIVSYDPTDTNDGSLGAATDGNISLMYADYFSSTSFLPSLQFGLVDNVVVTGPGGNLPGDFDNDNDVDGQDFLEWQRTDGTPGGLTDWQSNYPAPLSAVSAVPEPSALVAGMLAALGMLVRRQRTM